MFCRECGMKNADNAKFCAGCGAKLEDFQVIDSQSEKNKLDNEEKANKKKRKAGMIVAVVMAVLAIVAVIFFLGEKVYQTIVEPSGEKYSTESGNEDGKVYQMIEESSDEKYVIQVENEEGKYGYIDESGKEVIPCEYDTIYPFNEDGYALVIKEIGDENKRGLIDSKGIIILPCEYDYIIWNKGIGALYYKDTGDKTKHGVIDAEGNIIPCEYDFAGYFGTNGLAPVQNGELYGFVNRNNEIVIPMRYSVTIGFGEGDLAAVANEDFKWGYINEKGEQIIPFQYDNASQFNKNGIALVSKEEQTYIIDKSGEIVKKLSGIRAVGFNFEKIEK